MMKRAALLLLAAASLLFSLTASADIPKAKGDIYVQDFADVLNVSQETELIQLGRQLEGGTTAQIAVLTVDSLEGESMEEYSTAAFRQYGIGSEEENNGVLIVMAMEEREIRIEVGYGLEGALPDGKVGRILDEYALPYLKNNQPDEAIIQTYKVLYNETAQEYGWNGEQTTPAAPSDNGRTVNPFLIAVIAIVVITLDLKFFGGILTHLFLSILARGSGGGNGPRGGGGGSSGGGGAGRGW